MDSTFSSQGPEVTQFKHGINFKSLKSFTRKVSRESRCHCLEKESEECGPVLVYSKIVFFVVLVWMLSCTHAESKNNLAYSFIEKFLHNGMSLGEVKKIWGKPDEIFKIPNIPYDIYGYNNKKTKFKEWSFTVDKNGEIASLNYEPDSDPLLDRSEILLQTWKKYHCRKKRKMDTSVKHVVSEVTFFECADGKIRAYYNVYGEVSTIAVER